tara:strand:+ start:183 stop:395 length:213 start_codon:yes stop_codon:yes gene_type:complete
MIWRHPKYYAELRKRARLQAGKPTSSQAQVDKPANPEPKAQASSQTQQDQESSSQSTSEQAHDPGCKQPG